MSKNLKAKLKMTPEHIKDKIKLQIAVNALLELREEAISGSLEMCTIDATLSNIGVEKKFIHHTPIKTNQHWNAFGNYETNQKTEKDKNSFSAAS